MVLFGNLIVAYSFEILWRFGKLDKPVTLRTATKKSMKKRVINVGYITMLNHIGGLRILSKD